MKRTYDQLRTQRQEADKRFDLHLNTRVPEKWRAVDLETGNVWVWVHGRWQRASASEVIETLETIGREPPSAPATPAD